MSRYGSYPNPDLCYKHGINESCITCSFRENKTCYVLNKSMNLKCCDIVLRAFMGAMFNQEYEGVGGTENWEAVYTEYIDLSGIGETQQYNLLVNIHNIQKRIVAVQGYIDIEKEWFKMYNEPFEPALIDLRKYGHRLTWDIANPKQFIQQLEMCEIKEKTQIAELDSYIKELEDLKKDGPKVTTDGRKEFVKQMNRLGKHGYKIDKDKTDMEEYSLMIKEYDEELKQRIIDNEKTQK